MGRFNPWMSIIQPMLGTPSPTHSMPSMGWIGVDFAKQNGVGFMDWGSMDFNYKKENIYNSRIEKLIHI